MKADVVVIGAGVQGCAVAWRLARAGRSVLVLERAIPGAEASSAAGGILSPGVEALEPGPFYALGRASLARYPSFVEALERESGAGGRPPRRRHAGGGLRRRPRPGCWRAGPPRSSRPACRSTVLDDAEVRRLEPGLSPEARGALWFEDEGSLDPRALGRALSSAAQRAGADFITGRVLAIRHQGGRAVGVDHERGPHRGRRGGAGGRRLEPAGGRPRPAGRRGPAGARADRGGRDPPAAAHPRGLLRPRLRRAPRRRPDPARLHHGGGGLREGGHRRRAAPRPRGGHRPGAGPRAGAGGGDLVQLPPRQPRRRAHPRPGRRARPLLRHRPHPQRHPALPHHRRRHRRLRAGRAAAGGAGAVLGAAVRGRCRR